MQIKINLQIFIFVIIFILTRQIEIYAWLMLFIFLHEMGHLIVGMLLGLKPKLLHINPFGLSIIFETFCNKKMIEIKKILIALAGPFVNLTIFLIALMLDMNEDLKQTIIYSNLFIFICNLIPIYPLDGGRIILSLLKLKYNELIADTIVNKISNAITIIITILSSILILYYKNIAILFLIIYLWIIVVKENKEYNLKKRVYDIISASSSNVKDKV